MAAAALAPVENTPPAAANGRPSPRQLPGPRVNGSRLSATLHYNYETAARARTQAAANDPQYGAAKGRALYEEYNPFGTTAYRAHNNSIDVSAKRYRYTGTERDEETGLAYHGARYYASWLGRWTAADPIGLAGGINRFEYSRGNPIRLSDPSGMAPPQDDVVGAGFDAPQRDNSADPWITTEFYTGRASGLAQAGVDFVNKKVAEANANQEAAAAAKDAARAKAKADFISRKDAQASKSRPSGLTGADIQEFAAGVNAGVERAAAAVGELAQDVGSFVSPGLGVTAGVVTHTAVELGGKVLTGGVALAAAATEIPSDVASSKQNVVEGAKIGDPAQVGVGVLQAVKAAGTVASLGLVAFGGSRLATTSRTEVVQRAMSQAELEATLETGLVRGGRPGTHYVSDAVNASATRAQLRLGLPQRPEVRATLDVPRGRFSPPSRVEPKFNMPGGGMERTATGNVRARVLRVDEF